MVKIEYKAVINVPFLLFKFFFISFFAILRSCMGRGL